MTFKLTKAQEDLILEREFEDEKMALKVMDANDIISEERRSKDER